MRAADLARALGAVKIKLPRYKGGTYRCACPRCNREGRDDALAVTIHNDTDVVWWCHGCRWTGGWKAGELEPSAAAEIVSHRRQSAKRNHGSGLSDYGQRTVGEAELVTAEDPAGRHLTGRCCALPRNAVLFHPAVWHPMERRAYPTMVAVITDIYTAEPISLHFTFLKSDGTGKADIERPRLYLGGHRKSSGVVRLTPDDELTHGIILGEGLETCLSYALEFSGIWACLDTGNLGNFPVLPGIEGVTVLIDNDDAGHRAFAAVRDRYRGAGFMRPLDFIGIEVSGDPGADVNDLVAA
jgi:hypothetical protein